MEELKMENKDLKENNIENKYGIEYTKVGDYYIPNLVLEKRKNYAKQIWKNEIKIFKRKQESRIYDNVYKRNFE